LNRFYQVVIEPGISRALPILALAIAGHGDEPNMCKFGRLTNEPGNLVAIETRKANVEQNGIRSERFCGIKDRRTIVNFLRRAAESLKEQTQSSRRVDVVLDD
jgi:hypothetical protein